MIIFRENFKNVKIVTFSSLNFQTKILRFNNSLSTIKNDLKWVAQKYNYCPSWLKRSHYDFLPLNISHVKRPMVSWYVTKKRMKLALWKHLDMTLEDQIYLFEMISYYRVNRILEMIRSESEITSALSYLVNFINFF